MILMSGQRAPDGLGEPEAVHRTRHFDICEDHSDVVRSRDRRLR
jgi:hypothetical protein